MVSVVLHPQTTIRSASSEVIEVVCPPLQSVVSLRVCAVACRALAFLVRSSQTSAQHVHVEALEAAHHQAGMAASLAEDDGCYSLRQVAERPEAHAAVESEQVLWAIGAALPRPPAHLSHRLRLSTQEDFRPRSC